MSFFRAVFEIPKSILGNVFTPPLRYCTLHYSDLSVKNGFSLRLELDLLRLLNCTIEDRLIPQWTECSFVTVPSAIGFWRAANGSSEAVAYRMGKSFELNVFYEHTSRSEDPCRTSMCGTVNLALWALNDAHLG